MSESRLLTALRALVRESLPQYDYLAPRRYRVVRTVGERVELQIAKAVTGLPDLLPLALSPGMAGLHAELTPGAMVLLQFVDGDPSQPVVTHFSRKDDPGFLPVRLLLDASTSVAIGAPASPGAARVGDSVSCGYLTGTSSPGGGPVTLVLSGAPIPGAVELSGVITSGSTKVTVE